MFTKQTKILHMTDKNVDILVLHTNIQNSFEKEKENIPEYKKRLEDLEITFKNPKMPSRTRNEIEKNIITLKEKIRKIESCEEYNFYIAETGELIERYNNLLKIPVKMSFVGKPVTNSPEKAEIVKKFQKIFKI